MTTRTSMGRTEAIEEAASFWLIRRDSGNWTPLDEVRLQEWLNASTLHRVALWRLENAWEDAARLKALGAGVADCSPPPRGEWHLSPFFDLPDQHVGLEEGGVFGMNAEGTASPDEATRVAAVGSVLAADRPYSATDLRAKTRGPLSALGFVMAASVLFAIAGAAHFALNFSGDRYATPVGGIASVPLQDGSQITLNTATEVHVTLSGKERDIELSRGEAFFAVAKDAQRPFVVNAGKKRLIAVGTEFSVRRDADAIRVIVSEGTVRMEDRSAPGSARTLPVAAAGSTDAVLLSAGSFARAGDSGVLVQKESKSQTEEQLSWRDGLLMFRDQTLAAAAAEFNRYNQRQIVIGDPTVAGLRIEGNFRATNVEAFVRLLQIGYPLRASENATQIELRSH